MLRITLRIVCLLVGLSSAVGVRTTSASNTSAPPSGGDQQIAGERLVLKDSPAEAKGSLFSLSRDQTITLGGGNGSADDPTQFGGSLRVRTTTGDRFDSTYNLPTAGWRTIGAAGQNKGYRFTSKTGPINRIMIIPGRRIQVLHDQDAIRFGHRQRPQQDVVHDGEERRVGADAQGQRQPRGDGECLVFGEQAEADAQIVAHRSV